MKIMNINNSTNQQSRPTFTARPSNLDSWYLQIQKILPKEVAEALPDALAAKGKAIRAIKLGDYEPYFKFVIPDHSSNVGNIQIYNPYKESYNWGSFTYRDKNNDNTYTYKSAKEIADGLVEGLKKLVQQISEYPNSKNIKIGRPPGQEAIIDKLNSINGWQIH